MKSTISIKSRDCSFIYALKTALGPDSRYTPRDMKIDERVVLDTTGECIYFIEITVTGDLVHAIKRSRSTVEEVLALVNLIHRAVTTIR